jgi:hypothetical protein
MRPDARLSRNNEEYRLLEVYEEARAEEIAASSRLLHPTRSLSHPAYMQLVADLRVMRTECDQKMLAVKAHHNKRIDWLIDGAHHV